MSFYTSPASFATTAAPTFHATSSTKRGCHAVMGDDDTSYLQDERRSHKRIKISTPEPVNDYQSHQASFQVPITFNNPSDRSTCFAYGGGDSSQAKKRGRSD